jgi:hypothetical protein
MAAWIMFAASAALLVTSATEARFALPLALFGMGGCALLAGDGIDVSAKAGRMWVAGALVGALAVYGIGLTGLQHPVDGPGTLAACAAE